MGINTNSGSKVKAVKLVNVDNLEQSIFVSVISLIAMAVMLFVLMTAMGGLLDEVADLTIGKINQAINEVQSHENIN